MATVTTSTGSRARLSQNRPVHQQSGESVVSASLPPALSLKYSHSVSVCFQIDPRILLPLLPKGLEPELVRSSYYVNLTATHYRRSSFLGLPVVPPFNSLVLSTHVRASTDASLKGKFVFRRRISRNLAAWQLQRKLDLEPTVGDIKWKVASDDSASLPAVNFHWKAGEELNYLKVRARTRLRDVLGHPKARWILDHRSEFAVTAGRNNKSSQRTLQVHHALPDAGCRVYDVAQAGFKCGTRKLFGVEFSKALARRPAAVFLMCDGTKAFTDSVQVERKG